MKRHASIDPRGRTTITIFAGSFRLRKQNKLQVRILIVTGGTVGLAEWIIDETAFFNFSFIPFGPVMTVL